jgi:hypothetical protein
VAIYKRTAITAKEGVNFIRAVVENGGSLFIKIDQESDLGVDAVIEFIRNEQPLSKQIGVQIRSGQSYYDGDASECVFPIGSHRAYWQKYPLPVFGLVYVPTLKAAYWINIKQYLKNHPHATVIRYAATEANKLDQSSFTRLFVPGVVGETPVLEFDEALRLAQSNKADERYLGLLVLFRKYPNVPAVWDELIKTFLERPRDEIAPVLIYWLAHIPWHGDIVSVGERITEETRAYVRTLFAQFGFGEVIKLLSFIDEENAISRGSIGQSVEAIASSLPRAAELMRQVLATDDLPLFMRECAAVILAMHEGREALVDIAPLVHAGSSAAAEIIDQLRKYGAINPY